MIDKRKNVIEKLPWCIDKIEFLNGTVMIKGWAYHDNNHIGEIFCNEQRAISSKYDKIRKDLPLIFPFWPEARVGGFECYYDLAGDSGTLEFKYNVNSNECDELQNYFYKIKENFPIPDQENRIRVHGSPLLPAFKLEGYSAYRKIKSIVESEIPNFNNKGINVLDWGCGCGRVSRYLKEDYQNLWNADIDSQNLKWCKENLDNEIIQLAPVPNGRLRDYNFDLIIGVSVMSHLSSTNQIDWLKELYDALNDDGILILSFHGVSSAIRSMSEELFLEYYKFGFLDLRENRSLKEILPDHKGYRDVYNTIGFIEEHWCDAFQIIKIYESIIGNSQDLVVLAK
jgi:SAM-dependent methyltransferase